MHSFTVSRENITILMYGHGHNHSEVQNNLDTTILRYRIATDLTILRYRMVMDTTILKYRWSYALLF